MTLPSGRHSIGMQVDVYLVAGVVVFALAFLFTSILSYLVLAAACTLTYEWNARRKRGAAEGGA